MIPGLVGVISVKTAITKFPDVLSSARGLQRRLNAQAGLDGIKSFGGRLSLGIHHRQRPYFVVQPLTACFGFGHGNPSGKMIRVRRDWTHSPRLDSW
jgi:hypothetical protein